MSAPHRRILLVGMAHSVHIARICATLRRHGWDVHLFPAMDAPPHAELRNVVLFDPDGVRPQTDALEVRAVPPGSRALAAHRPLRALSLASVIRDLRPALVHAHEIQISGYLTVAARKLSLGRFPPLLLSAWGSDISLRARLAAERRRIRETLRHVDVFTAECERDIRNARRLGFRGETVLPQPIVVGFDLERARALRTPGSTSARRTIAIKGYQSWAGRAQVALRALELTAERLTGYRIALYLAADAEAKLATMLANDTGLEFDIIRVRKQAPHDDILALHGRSRVSIGLSIADGTSTSFLEALVMGSFPIQSDAACVNEWIEDGVTGAIVPAEDPNAVAAALIRAVQDDALVDAAAAVNDVTVAARLDAQQAGAELSRLYERLAAGRVVRVGA